MVPEEDVTPETRVPTLPLGITRRMIGCMRLDDTTEALPDDGVRILLENLPTMTGPAMLGLLDEARVVGFLRDDAGCRSRLPGDDKVVGLVIEGLGSELRTPIVPPIPREAAIAEPVARPAEGAASTLELIEALGVCVLMLPITLEPLRLLTETYRLTLGREKWDDRLDEKLRVRPEGRELTGLPERDDRLLAEGRLTVGLRLAMLERLDAAERLGAAWLRATLDGRLTEGLLRLGLAA